MHLLLAFASVEGQTRKIARHIYDWLADNRHSCLFVEVGDDTGAPDMTDIDGVIIAGPVHAGTFPGALEDYVKANHVALMSVPGAFISVSLSAASDNPDEVEEVGAMVNAFGNLTGFWPVTVHHAAGALKYTEYDFVRKWLMKRIAEKEGGPTDTSQDYEFTDWAALDRFLAHCMREFPVAAGKI